MSTKRATRFSCPGVVFITSSALNSRAIMLKLQNFHHSCCLTTYSLQSCGSVSKLQHSKWRQKVLVTAQDAHWVKARVHEPAMKCRLQGYGEGIGAG